jgi:DNA-binding response OmpR family regulator
MSKPKHILIVDDSEFDRQLMLKVLSRVKEYSVSTCPSGAECLAFIAKQKVDLILLDIMMPGELGTQIVKKIREQANHLELPVIMLSGKSDTDDITGSLALGANDYITKPIKIDIALSRIATHLKMADFSREMASLQEIAALHGVVVTYNHEINNPLAIISGCLEILKREHPGNDYLLKAEAAVWRIAQVMKDIKDVVESKEVKFESYTDSFRMMKIK